MGKICLLAYSQMSELIEHLKQLAKEYSVRSPAKLVQVGKKVGAHVTLKEAKQALATNVPAQTLGPPPRSLGHSAAEGPHVRLQADLMDFSQNTHGHHNDQHRYALQVSDVFTRKAYTEPLKGKSAIQVDTAMRKIRDEIPGNFSNAVITTDKGGEFAGLDRILPQGAAHRTKEGVNDLSVVDRSMQTLKRDLEDKAQTTGQGWAHNLKEATSNYNFRPNSSVHGSPDDAGKEGPQQFMIYQDQASNFLHNRTLYINRQKVLQNAEGYREPIYNGGRSFKPAYGALHNLKKIAPGAGHVVDSRGNEALLKEVRPATKGSGEPLAHITFQKRAEKPREERKRAEVPEAPDAPEPPTQRAGEPERPRPNVQVGGSSASGINEPMQTRFSDAQLRRTDPVSVQIATYVRKTTDQQRQAAADRKAAALALREAAKNERDNKAAAKEAEKQNKQLARIMKKPIT
jgi:hypothetical protein